MPELTVAFDMGRRAALFRLAQTGEALSKRKPLNAVIRFSA